MGRIVIVTKGKRTTLMGRMLSSSWLKVAMILIRVKATIISGSKDIRIVEF